MKLAITLLIFFFSGQIFCQNENFAEGFDFDFEENGSQINFGDQFNENPNPNFENQNLNESIPIDPSFNESFNEAGVNALNNEPSTNENFIPFEENPDSDPLNISEDIFPEANPQDNDSNQEIRAFQQESSAFRSPEDDIVPIIQKIETPNLFAGAPPIPGSLRNLARGEAPEEYKIETGDTLFDICDQLLDEPAYWPKLWALNPYIRNPHFIFPGMVLRFYPGDSENPPFLQVVFEDDIIPVDRSELDNGELIQQDIDKLLTRAEVPEATPVIGISEINEFPEIDEAFLREGDIFRPTEYRVVLPAIFSEEKLIELGTVALGASGNLLSGSKSDIIIESAQKEPLEASQNLSIVRYSGALRNQDGNFIAHRYEFVGQVSIESRVDELNFIGSIQFTNLGVQPGDLIIAYRAANKTVAINQGSRQGSGERVVGFEYAGSSIGGRGNFVVIETQGSQMPTGQSYYIYQKNNAHRSNSFSNTSASYKKLVGEAQILENFGPVAIAYITSDKHEIRIGDDTGGI